MIHKFKNFMRIAELVVVLFLSLSMSNTCYAERVAFWHFEETDTKIYDSANDHNGTATADVVADTQVPGPPLADYPPYNTYSRSFPGDTNGGHIQIPDDSALDLINDFTLELWVKTRQADVAGYMLGKHESGNHEDGSWYFEFHANLLHFKVLPSGPDINIFSNPIDTNNTWTHFAFTYRESGDTYAFYVDGAIAGSGTAGIAGEILDTSRVLRIGCLESHPASFIGNIDEVQIWDENRTQAQIQQDMVAIPEPTTFLLLSLGGLALLRKRRQ